MPAHSSSPSVVVDGVSFSWADGTTALSGVSGSFGSKRTGLVGRNGSGKSTLLRLIAGELAPGEGHITTSADVAYLPRLLTLDTDRPVADLLGIGAALRGVRAVERGDTDPRHFDAIGSDWDVEARAGAALAEAGLAPDMLDRRVGELSGGEAVLTAIAGIRLAHPSITLLDEPTNNLDREARARLSQMVLGWRGTIIVVSHDTALLDLMDETSELYANELSTFGGGYSQWRQWLDAEQHAARQAERDATQAVRREKRQRIEAETTIARRVAMGRKASDEKREPKIIMNAKKGAQQVSAGRLRGEKADREAAARAALDSAERRVRDDDAVKIDLPDPGVPVGRRIATIGTWVIQGPERVAVIGPNGAGKTTLLERLVFGDPPFSGPSATGAGHPPGSPRVEVAHDEPILRTVGARLHTDRVGYLPQRVDGLDDAASVLDAVTEVAPHVGTVELRNRLARFLIRGDAVHRPVGTLSGGERFRVALARLLLADPPPQLLVFDEPTNNLDLDTVDQFVAALSAYRGAVLIVSHDDAFLARIGGRSGVLELGRDGVLTER